MPDALIPPGERRHPSEIIEEVSAHYGVDPADVCSPSRRQHLSEPRAMIAVELRRQGLSWDAIGELLGNRDHSVLIYLVKKYGPRPAKTTRKTRRKK